jgi:hypothetical protein
MVMPLPRINNLGDKMTDENKWIIRVDAPCHCLRITMLSSKFTWMEAYRFMGDISRSLADLVVEERKLKEEGNHED